MHQLLIAAATAAAKTNNSSGLFLIVILVVLAAFMFMRPGRKRARQQQEQMRKQVVPGAEVRTNAGLYASVTAVSDEFLTLEVAPGVFCRYDPRAVVAVVNQGPNGADFADAAAATPAEAPADPAVVDASVVGASPDVVGGEAADSRQP